MEFTGDRRPRRMGVGDAGDAEGRRRRFAKRSRLRSIIRDLVEKKSDPSMLVYVRFRGASEVEQQA